VEIRRIQQFGLPVLKPLGAGKTLALRTIPVSAGNGKLPLVALWAKSVMGS
jgi:hypothetical protein